MPDSGLGPTFTDLRIKSRRPFIEAGHAQQAAEDVATALQDGVLVEGLQTAGLERTLERQWNRRAIVARSGMDAIELLFEAINIEGRLVFLPANCFPAIPAAACRMGGRVVPVDIDRASMSMVMQSVAGWDLNGAVVFWVHHCGMVAPRCSTDISRLRAEGCFVVEDCAQVLPASAGNEVGTWGDATILSFGPTKALSAGAGGALLSSNGKVISEAARRRSHGPEELWRSGDVAVRDRRIDELNASVARRQISRLDTIRERFAAINRLYEHFLRANCPSVLLGDRPITISWGRFPIQLPAAARSSDVRHWLATKAGIECSVMYERPWFDYPWFSSRSVLQNDCKEWVVLRGFLESGLCLPYFECLKGESIATITTELRLAISGVERL